MEILVGIFYGLGFVGLVVESIKFTNQKVEDAKVDKVIYVLWGFLGLFSSQWVLFALLWMLMIVPQKYSKIESFLAILLIILIIVNKYHLHITI